MFWARCLGLLLLLPLVAAPVARGASATTVRLVLPVQAAQPGQSFNLGVEFAMRPGWHTYWRNGGDSGAPSSIEWTLPPGVTAGAPRWPAPERLVEQDLITYVYHGTVTLLVPISIAPTVAPGDLELAAAVRWLECEKQCLPGRTSLKATLKIAPQAVPSPDAPALRAAEDRLPKPLPPGAAQAAWDGPAKDDLRPLVIRWRTAAQSGTPEFFPDSATTFEAQASTQRLPDLDGFVVLRKTVKRLEGAWPTEIRGVLAHLDSKGVPTQAFEAVLAVADTAAFAPAPAAPAAPAPSGSSPPPVPTISFGRALLLGFLGGMILNIMPCVLPVIALKILGFVRQSGSRPAEIRKLGIIYGLGVWFSFIVLAGVVIGVKHAAGAASWGMQFGNPVFLVAMTALVLLVSLSLFGVFEITVTGRAMDAAGELASKEGPAGAFFNGMLAVALATPCTAPLLAPALGYAFAADSLTIVSVFSAVAFGLAAPYVILSCQPSWLKFLPKPGAWMEYFKVAMGFPMLATALWLYTLAADRFGAGGPLWLGLFLVGLALAAWIFGEFVQRGRRQPTVALILAGMVAVGFYVVALEQELNWRHPRNDASETRSEPTASGQGVAWQPWSPEAVASARRSGRPVFVDFTAEWCLTCKLNERSSIDVPEVREKLRAVNAVTLKGDHTRVPANITEELQRFGRAGVPLVLVYPRDPQKPPAVLPEVLTPGIVLKALEEAVR